jgi:hypothetical protein
MSYEVKRITDDQFQYFIDGHLIGEEKSFAAAVNKVVEMQRNELGEV